MTYLNYHRVLRLTTVFSVLVMAPASWATEQLSMQVIPHPYPEASSVAATLRGGLLVGTSTDDSALSGQSELELSDVLELADTAQITELTVILDDGMDFSLAFGTVQASAEPGATEVTLIDPGPPGELSNGQFSQLGNLFQFDGRILLTSQGTEQWFDLSTVDAVEADLVGVQLSENHDQIVAQASIDVTFTETLSADSLPFDIPLEINIQGAILATADKPLAGDLDGDGVLDAEDIDQLSEAVRTGSDDLMFDLNGDSLVTGADRTHWVDVLKNTYFGDSDLDRDFDSADLLMALQAGRYEAPPPLDSAGWAQGDWDGDADFDTSDFLLAFQSGGYEQGPPVPAAPTPEPATWWLIILAIPGLLRLHRRRLA